MDHWHTLDYSACKTKGATMVIHWHTFLARKHAKEILGYMRGVADFYGILRVSDYYDLCGHKATLSDTRFGWGSDDVKKMRVARIGDQYTIAMPKARYLSI